MSTEKDEPALAKLGAGTDTETRDVNLDVSGTVGPDHLGQETTTVPGHANDRPGVRSRIPEENPEDPRIRRMDTGVELPVLLSSNMKTDPIEGTQGSYTSIVEGQCARCGYDRLKVSVATLPGERREVCNACGAVQDGRDEDGYRMPATEKERADQRRNAGPTLGEIHRKEVIDLQSESGYGPMVSIVDDRSSWTLWKDDVDDLFWMLVENDDIDIADSLKRHLRPDTQAVVSAALLPDALTVRARDGE